jgi:hypothetical protein
MIIGGNESAMNLRGDEVFFATFRERGANLSEHLACELPRIPLLETVWKFEWAFKLVACEPLNERQRALVEVVCHPHTPLS